MVISLAIKNYALIDDIRVDFNAGLTIITGETGAGKSILLGALALVLGKRADLKVMRSATEKCVIEAEFSIATYALEQVFQDNDLDYEAHTILRREILPSGKSRAFVNDTPVTLQQMQHLGERLIDVHSQNDTQTLSTEGYQMEVIDALADNEVLLRSYSESLNNFKAVIQKLNELRSQKEQAVKEHDYHNFLYTELKDAGLKNLDQLRLEETFEKLNNTEEIKGVLSQLEAIIGDEPAGVLNSLGEARSSLAKIQRFSSEYELLWGRLNSVVIELEDMYSDMQSALNDIEPDPQQLMQINTALQTLYKLQQKHTVSTVEELIAIENDLASKLEVSSNIEQRIEELEKELEDVKNATSELAIRLHENRQKAIPVLKEKLEVLLKDLGLPNAQFQFNLKLSETFRSNGTDILELLFTANKGMALGPLHKVASGGEMSRIMLSVKAVLTQYKNLPTLIFDEIDTGVSGEIAHKMAGIMSDMSKKMQVISITHLPQIAAKGDYHKKVFKAEENNRTHTRMKDLTEDARILEIAQMIGGNTVSDSALAHARQLLN